MELTARRKQLLNCIVSEYVSTADPVSSQTLEKKYHVGCSPATLRSEMKELSDGGFLYQPHTSAGRIPTERGYRFFVDSIQEKPQREKRASAPKGTARKKRGERDEFFFIDALARKVAALSGGFVLTYLEAEERGIVWKEGWEEILREPEFDDQEYVVRFTKFLGDIESSLKTAAASEEVRVYIGKENPFSRVDSFSVIMTECPFTIEERGIVALLGPTRMEYAKNIRLMGSLRDLWFDENE